MRYGYEAKQSSIAHGRVTSGVLIKVETASRYQVTLNSGGAGVRFEMILRRPGIVGLGGVAASAIVVTWE